jgi:hypothetical protein
MAKRGDPCYRCGGGKILTQFKHVQSGVCFRCGGSGMDPGPDPSQREYRREAPRKRLPRPNARDSKALADQAFAMVAERFGFAEGDRYARAEAGFDSVEEVYMNLGHHLAAAVFDPRFDRAVERARARIPAKYRRAFEANLAQGIRQWAQDFEVVVWEGR